MMILIFIFDKGWWRVLCIL